MHPARFVDLSFLYAGTLLIVQYAVIHGFDLAFEILGTVGLGLIFWAFAVTRMRKPADDVGPTDYGPFIYVLTALCLVLTVLTALCLVLTVLTAAIVAAVTP